MLLDPATTPDVFKVPDWWSPQQRVEMALALARLDARSPAVLRLVALAEPFASAMGRARAALLAVQSLPFVRDPAGEWLARGRYTAKHGGDCLRLSPLLVVVAESVGVRGAVVWLYQPSALQDHVTAELAPEGQWLWAETTVRGAWLGESPYRASERTQEKGGL